MSKAEPYSVTDPHTELPKHHTVPENHTYHTEQHISDVASDAASPSELQRGDKESRAITSSSVSHPVGEEEQLKTETLNNEPLESRAKPTDQQHRPEPESPTITPTPTFEPPMSQWDASR